MFKVHLQLAGAPDPEHPGVDLLWILVGTKDSCDAGRCFCLPPSNCIAGPEDLIPACQEIIAAGFPEVTSERVFQAWKSYRDSRRGSFTWPGSECSPADAVVKPIAFAIHPTHRLVSYSVKGIVRSHDAKAFLDVVLAHPQFHPGFNFIGDRREMVTARGDEYARAVAGLVEANSKRLGSCRWAVLVPDPVAYGMARMWSLMASETSVTIQPFFEVREAVEWLGLPHGSGREIFKDQIEDG